MSIVATRNLTTLDIIKTWALAIMVIDHIGFFILPEDVAHPIGDPHLWLRVIGRLSAPVWFFLIGFARSRDLTPPIWIAAFAMLATSMISGLWVFPLDIMFTFILIRFTIDKVAAFTFLRLENLFLTLFSITILSVHTAYLFEYGSVGMLLALFGYAVRNGGPQSELPLLRSIKTINIMYWSCLALYSITQFYFFPFDRNQFAMVVVGSAGLLYVLQYFKSEERPDIAARLGGPMTAVFKFLGRHTMAFYVIHINLFRIFCWSMGVGYPLYGWFDWDLMVWATFAKMHLRLGL